MDKFWQIAVSICGFGAVGAFVFWSLYNQWLRLSIFGKLTSTQTFIVMLTFLGLTFFSLISMLVVYVIKPSSLSNGQNTSSGGGTGLEGEASHPMPRPGVYIEDARSRRGGLTATDSTGRGAEVKKVEVEEDIQVSSTSPQEHSHPKLRPPD
jgi:hypothetical protein